MPMYEAIPPRVEAEQLDRDNAKDLEMWCGGHLVEEIDPIDSDLRWPGINVPTAEGNKRASYTDYILRWPSGQCEVMTAGEFQATYRPVG